MCVAVVVSCGGPSRTTTGDAGEDATDDPGADTVLEPDPDVDEPVHDTAVETSDPGMEPVDDPTGDAADVTAEEVDALERGECVSSTDCGGRPCVRVPDEPGGYWLCEVAERDEATDCSSTDPWVDQCCNSFECIGGTNGGCFFSDWGWGFCGGAIMPHNVCVYDECAHDSDCTAGPNAICVPRHIQDWPRTRCAYGTCRTSVDCTREPGGFCTPVFDFCCSWRISGFFCIYPGACQYHADCAGDLNGCVGDLSTGGTYCDTIACPL